MTNPDIPPRRRSRVTGNSGSASGGRFTLTGLTTPKRHKAMEWPRPTDKKARRGHP